MDCSTVSLKPPLESARLPMGAPPSRMAVIDHTGSVVKRNGLPGDLAEPGARYLVSSPPPPSETVSVSAL